MIFVVSGISSRKALRISASVLVSTALVESSRIRIFGLFQKGTCNTQTLLLAAGDIVSALNDHGIVSGWKFTDKAICLCEPADFLHLFVAEACSSPQRIFS